MDLELCQLDQIYLTDLAGYNHIVNQRKPSSERSLPESFFAGNTGDLGYSDVAVRKKRSLKKGGILSET